MQASDTFIANVIRLREARGLSQQQLATLAGISPHTVKAMELKRTQNPTLDTITRLAVALRVEAGELMREPSSDPDALASPPPRQWRP